MKKLELIDLYKHPEFVLGLDIEGNIVLRDKWFNVFSTFSADAPLEGVEICLKALGFTKGK